MLSTFQTTAKRSWLWRSALVPPPPWLAGALDAADRPGLVEAQDQAHPIDPMHQKVCRVGLCPRSLAALAALLLQLGCVARARAASPRFDSFIPGSGIAVLSVLCTLHARCGTRAACTCFSAAPHTHQAASAFAGPPTAPHRTSQPAKLSHHCVLSIAAQRARDVRREALREEGAGALRQDHRPHREALLWPRPGQGAAGPRRAEGTGHYRPAPFRPPSLDSVDNDAGAGAGVRGSVPGRDHEGA